MRRGRFAALSESATTVRALSFLDVFLFDIYPTSGDDERIASDRVRALTSAGLYLIASHSICAIVLAIHAFSSSFTGNPFTVVVPLFSVLVLAALSSVYLNRQRTRLIAPHVVIRLWIAFSLAVGGLWCTAIGIGLPLHDGQVPGIVYASLLGAFCLTVVAFVSIPSLLVTSYLVAVTAFFLFSADWQVIGLLVAFGGCLLGASIFGARDALIAAARRIAAEYKAQKAARFVDEFEHSGRGWFWETDAEGALTYVSTHLADQLQQPASEFAGKHFADVLSVNASAADVGLERTLGFHISSRLSFSDVTVQAKDQVDVQWSVSGTPHFDEYGRFLGFSGIGVDLTEKRRADAEINKLARFDALTGLANRTLMKTTLAEAIQGIDKRRTGCAIFLIDLDRFKNVNDTLGHPVGDALLKQVATRLTSVVGKDGQVGRIGGDEFKAVFPSIDSEAWLSSTAARLIERVSQPYLIDGHNIVIGASIGIAIARTIYQCPDALVRDADLALYAAKDDGRGTFKIFAPDMHSEAQERQSLEQDLRGALQNGQLRLVYQPIVNTNTEEVVGFEALARWVHPLRGPVPTETFISLAEDCGLILPIGEWVLRTACSEAASWPAQLRIAVNISPIQFASPGLIGTVMNTLATTGLEPERLELEITEGVFLCDGPGVDETFKRLKAAGVRLALDDFGTGYSSLGYLKRAPLDKLKIDQSFVRGAAATGSTSEAILRSIISLAQSLKMDTTAEGVETHDDLHLIRKLGCSQVQGYIFGKPMEAEQARALACSVESVAAKGFGNTRAPRYSLIRKAEVQWNGMSFPVRVRNISTGGALIESSRDVPPGSSIQLDLLGCGSFGAEVRWSQDERMGIKFERPFNLEVFDSKSGEPKSARVVMPSYLSTELQADSPWAARSDRLSATELKRAR